jgi:hypothetical protein
LRKLFESARRKFGKGYFIGLIFEIKRGGKKARSMRYRGNIMDTVLDGMLGFHGYDIIEWFGPPSSKGIRKKEE